MQQRAATRIGVQQVEQQSEQSEHAEHAEHVDLVVLGGGSGNTVFDDGWSDRRVVLVDSGPLGGTCLNRGCIPSKMYVHLAELLRAAEHAPALGGRTQVDGVDWPAVRERVVGRIDREAADGERGREEEAYVERVRGTARFTGPRRVRVTTAEGERTITADQVVIATGSRPSLPEVDGLAESPHHTSDTIMRIEELPRRLAVLGGGYVGCEFAHVFSSLGVEVTQVESADALLAEQDADVSRRFTEAAAQQWTVRLGVQAERVETTDGTTVLHLDDGSRVEVDLVLVATGRTPNGDLLDLDRAGVRVDDDGLVVVDEHQRTTAEGVWALGDVCQGAPLKHVANHEARVVKHNLEHPDDLEASDHDHVPQAVFSRPQVASVGLTEAQAREAGHDVVVGRAEYAGTAYGWALQAGPDDDSVHATGFVKVIADRATDRLVGAHLLGESASVLVQPLVQAMAFGLDASRLARAQLWIHPALTEVVEQALLDLADDD